MKCGRFSVVVLVCGFYACGGKSVSKGPGGTPDPGGETETRSCVSLCDKAKHCPDATSATTTIDCGVFCNAYENIARKGGCASALAGFFSCYADADICSTVAACDDDAIAVSGCLTRYCSANQTDADPLLPT
jgi:hypothetical protein